MMMLDLTIICLLACFSRYSQARHRAVGISQKKEDLLSPATNYHTTTISCYNGGDAIGS